MIDRDTFRKAFSGIVFDSVLLFVKFGRLELDLPDLGSRAEEMKKKEGVGKKHALFFFSWLKEKNVRNVIKVTVEDGATPSDAEKDYLPHSDSAISQSLANLDIEILDWRKIDLCPQTIVRGCSNSENP